MRLLVPQRSFEDACESANVWAMNEPEQVAQANPSSVHKEVVRRLRDSWQLLAATAIAYKVIALVVLTPLVGVLFRTLVGLSGRSILADQDILYFFLGPVGWVCFVVVGSLWLGIIALEQSALLAILCAAAEGNRLSVVRALQFTAQNKLSVIRVTARMLAWALVTIAPCLALVGLIFYTLLNDYDINFYLHEKPFVFWIAASLGGITGLLTIVALLRLAVNWFFALPLVLFENVDSAHALHVSRARVTGRRRILLRWIGMWVLASITFSALATSAVVFLGSVLVAGSSGSLGLMVGAVGTALSLSALVNLGVNLMSTTVLATLLFSLYGQFGRSDHAEFPKFSAVESSGATTIGFKLNRKRLLGGLLIGVVLAVLVGALSITTIRLDDHTEIAAHRGSSASAPENTMAAVRQAIEDGADWVEIDVQETADGQVVLFHDSDFMRIAGVDLKIWEATMDDLKEIDIGSGFAQRFSDERVVTLSDVLAECKGKIRVIIELKFYGHEQQLEQRTVEVVEAQGMGADVVVMSLNNDAVQKLKSLRPHWQVGLLTSVALGGFRNADADFFAVSARLATRRFIKSKHKIGKGVMVWTVNDAVTMSRMISRDIDVLITDRPALARRVLQQRAQMSAPERLLLELAGLLGVTQELGAP